jgi:hypothetical protein
MKALWLIGVSLILLPACGGHLPNLRPAGLVHRADLQKACDDIFPQTAYRVVHTMEITLPMDNKTSLIGISQGDPQKNTMRSILISAEGLVLFDAEINGSDQLTIHRSLPPLEERDFAVGLFSDVRLMFGRPEVLAQTVGWLDNGLPICRYVQGDEVRDVVLLPGPGGAWSQQRYQAEMLEKEVSATPPFSNVFAQEMQLSKPGITGYQIRFELIRLEQE